MKYPSSSRYAFWLAILRLYVGAFWLMHGIPKFTQSDKFMPPNGFMPGFIKEAIGQTTGPYQAFLSNTVLPNAGVFAELVRLGEVVCGALLVLGFFTRLGGLIGVLLSLNYMLAKGGFGDVGVLSGLDAAALALSAINLVLPTGRMLGIDAVLGRTKRVTASQPGVVTAPAGVRAEFVDEPPMNGPAAPPT